MALIGMSRRTASALHLPFELPAHGASVAEARNRVGTYLEGHGCHDDTCETAVLVVSELFTNALRHTASTTIGCMVRTDGEHLRIEVRDQGGSASPIPGPVGIEEVHGRGLLLVESLSAAWGAFTDALGQTVWCDIYNEAR